MKQIVVGLGNPGSQYATTRHNAGFILLDLFANSQGLTWEDNKKFNSHITSFENLILVKPQTFMNESGSAVSKLLEFYKINSANLIVIHDEIDLPFISVKKQFASGAAGHNGVTSIIDALGSKEFWRIRVGVGRPENKNIQIHDWVLSKFLDVELENLLRLKIEDLIKTIPVV